MSNEYPPPPPQPPSGYGYGYVQPTKNSGMAIASLVLGILGLVCCGCGVFSIAALVLGHLGKKEIAESNGTKTGAGLAQAGFILGIVGVVLGVLYWILTAVGTFDFNTYSNV
jgi:hypothetical protein